MNTVEGCSHRAWVCPSSASKSGRSGRQCHPRPASPVQARRGNAAGFSFVRPSRRGQGHAARASLRGTSPSRDFLHAAPVHDFVAISGEATNAMAVRARHERSNAPAVGLLPALAFEASSSGCRRVAATPAGENDHRRLAAAATRLRDHADLAYRTDALGGPRRCRGHFLARAADVAGKEFQRRPADAARTAGHALPVRAELRLRLTNDPAHSLRTKECNGCLRDRPRSRQACPPSRA